MKWEGVVFGLHIGVLALLHGVRPRSRHGTATHACCIFSCNCLWSRVIFARGSHHTPKVCGLFRCLETVMVHFWLLVQIIRAPMSIVSVRFVAGFRREKEWERTFASGQDNTTTENNLCST